MPELLKQVHLLKPLLNFVMYRAGTPGAMTACCSRSSLSSLQGRSQDLTQDLLNCSPFGTSNLGQIIVEPSLRSWKELVEITKKLWLLSFITSSSTLGKGESWLLAVQMLANDGDIPLRFLLVNDATFQTSMYDLP